MLLIAKVPQKNIFVANIKRIVRLILVSPAVNLFFTKLMYWMNQPSLCILGTGENLECRNVQKLLELFICKST